MDIQVIRSYFKHERVRAGNLMFHTDLRVAIAETSELSYV